MARENKTILFRLGFSSRTIRRGDETVIQKRQTTKPCQYRKGQESYKCMGNQPAECQFKRAGRPSDTETARNSQEICEGTVVRRIVSARFLRWIRNYREGLH